MDISNTDIIENYIQDIQDEGVDIKINVENGIIYLNLSSFNLFNTNNTQLGINSTISFLAGYLMGVRKGKDCITIRI